MFSAFILIAGEVWESFAPKPERKTLADFAAGQPYEIIYLPAGKAKAVHNLLAPHSLFVNGEYITLNELTRRTGRRTGLL
jgi:hypothetical protein